MNKNEFQAGIKKIELAYNTTFSVDKLKVWWESLKNMDANKYFNRIDCLIKEKQFIPNIAEILDNSNTSKQYANYEQRDYKDSDFNKFYIN